MFGFRPDGRRVQRMDPILQLMPYIMPERSDAMVWTPLEIDYEKMAAYIQAQRAEGRTVSFMDILIAAFLRMTAQYPEFNRFVANKQIYARNEFAVSFMVLKRDHENAEADAAAVKVQFSPNDTLFEIAEKVERLIEENRRPESEGINSTEQIARLLLSTPLLPNIIVGLLKLLDRYGFMPRIIHEASPFHTSLFITNMGSLGMNYVYHHIYNFGTTGVFLSIGKVKRMAKIGPKGDVLVKRVMPLGLVVDERISNGAGYARGFAVWKHYAENPALLETPPESIKSELRGTPRWEKEKAKA